MNPDYVQGFMDKCAEVGVDPEVLLKQAISWGPLTGKSKMLAKTLRSTGSRLSEGIRDTADNIYLKTPKGKKELAKAMRAAQVREQNKYYQQAFDRAMAERNRLAASRGPFDGARSAFGEKLYPVSERM